MPVDAAFPAPLQCLFVPKRYKILYGGRGGGRSWGVARALLLLGAQRTIRVLCVRELQKSIEDSVHQVLSDQINNLGLDDQYNVEKAKIFHKTNGTSFSFEGIKNNVNAIKSYEGITHCWVEEANKVSKNSWSVLIPTIRGEDSEIWVLFNPELDTDYTYKRFILDSRLAEVDGKIRFAQPIYCPIRESDTAFVVKMSWRDNPWFPEVLRVEMENDKRLDYDHYLNIWEGSTVQHLEGAVYAKELRAARLESRITVVPCERTIPVDVFWDLGRADKTTMWFIQRVAMQWRVLDYYEDSLKDLSYYVAEMQAKGYAYGTMFLPHDGKHKRLGQIGSIEDQLRKLGYRVFVAPQLHLHEGINRVRQIFPQCWFDEAKCVDGLNSLKRYRYKISSDGKRGDKPLHDDSDGADGFRTFAVTTHIGRLSGDVTVKSQRLVNTLIQKLKNPSESRPGQGWMA